MDQTTQTMIPLVDEWKPLSEQIIFTNAKNVIVAPLAEFYHLSEGNNKINYFMVNPKKSYNSDELRAHNCHYLNYFEAFYDSEKEYFTNLAHIKFLIDCYREEYHKDNFIYDINNTKNVEFILQTKFT